MVHTGHGDSTLTASLRQTIDENIPPDVDVWPLVQRRLTVSTGTSGRRRLTAAIIATALLLSAGVAVAQSDSIRIVISKLDPASVGAPIPRATEIVSLGEAERRAGIKVLRPVEGAGVRLISVEIVAPITEIQGRPVRDPQPTVRLVYKVGESNATVDEIRNPDPDQPMVVAIVGPTENTRIEDDGGVQRSYAYTSDGSMLASTLWGTREVWVAVSFSPSVGSGLGHEFIRSFR
jgi:hypothetical protein